VKLAAGALPRQLLERGASLPAHLDERAARPALTGGRLAADRATVGPVEDEIAQVTMPPSLPTPWGIIRPVVIGAFRARRESRAENASATPERQTWLVWSW
jgi:hypothetical protein